MKQTQRIAPHLHPESREGLVAEQAPVEYSSAENARVNPFRHPAKPVPVKTFTPWKILVFSGIGAFIGTMVGFAVAGIFVVRVLSQPGGATVASTPIVQTPTSTAQPQTTQPQSAQPQSAQPMNADDLFR